jgi:hypothetical protein
MAQFVTPEFANPYPDTPVQVTGFTYSTALVLMRLTNAVQTRRGEDASYVLAGDYQVAWTDGAGTSHDITVPRGMLTDLTSVPRGFRGIINRVGPWLEAAIVHDFLTIAWRTLDGDGSAERRKFADDIMFAAMDAANIGVRKWLIYGGIRLAAPFGYPQTVDPATQSGLYLDLTDPEIIAQLPPGIGPVNGGSRFV